MNIFKRIWRLFFKAEVEVAKTADQYLEDLNKLLGVKPPILTHQIIDVPKAVTVNLEKT